MVSMNNTKPEIYEAYQELEEKVAEIEAQEGNSYYEELGRLAEAYIRHEVKAKIHREMEVARGFRQKLERRIFEDA